jgi:ParB family chromosome partitioning protein
MSTLTQATSFDRELVSGNVKAAMKSADAKSRDLWMVSPSDLVIMSDFNVRVKNEDYSVSVREIADSIKANGFYPHKPFAVIVLKENGQDILAVYDGHTRYDGLQLAISEGYQVERVPCVSAPAGTSLEDITVGLVTNNNGRQLDPMGLGTVCKRLIGYGLNPAEISKRLGFTPAYVGNLLNLMSAPKKIRDMVADGKVAASLAISTLRDKGESAVSVLEEGLVKATASGKAKVTKKSLAPQEPKVNAPTALERGLEWISQNGEQESSYALLSFITGKSISQLKKLI